MIQIIEVPNSVVIVTEKNLSFQEGQPFFDCEYKFFRFQRLGFGGRPLQRVPKKSHEVLLFSSGSAFTVSAFAKPLRFA